MNIKSMFQVMSVAAVAAMPVSTAFADDAVSLRVADSFPVGHYISENGTKPWMEKIKSLTGGKVDFEYYPAEQLGKSKDMLSLTQAGTTDIGYVAPGFVSDKLPLSVVAELPLPFSKSCQGTNAYWSLVKEGGLLDKLEFSPAGVKALWVLVLPPYQLYMANDQAGSLDAVKGQKIRTSGSAKVLLLKKLGAVPVSIPSPEMREALHRGTIDGLLLPQTSVASYGLVSGLKSATAYENFGSFIVTYVISRDRWNAFTPEIKKAFDEAGDFAMKKACNYTDNDVAKSVAAQEKEGITFYSLDEADKARLKNIMGEVASEWAETMDTRGKAGTEVLKAFQAELSK